MDNTEVNSVELPVLVVEWASDSSTIAHRPLANAQASRVLRSPVVKVTPSGVCGFERTMARTIDPLT